MSTQGAIILSILMLVSGVIIFIAKSNILVMLIGIELIFNAANINFVVFNQYWISKGLDGQLMALFILAIVIAEMALALAIILQVMRAFGTSNIDEIDSIKE